MMKIEVFQMRPFVVLLVILVGISRCAADESVVPLANKTSFVICDGSKLIVLDQTTTRPKPLGEAEFVAYDPNGGYLLSTKFDGSDSNLTIRSTTSDFPKLLDAKIALRVTKIYWSGLRGRFYLCGISVRVGNGNIAFWSALCVFFDPKSGEFRAEPVPGISDMIAYSPADSPAVNQVHPGCFAYSAVVSHPELLAAAKSGNASRESDAYFVITKDWRPWKAWKLPGSPMLAHPICFSEDGNSLLAQISFSAQERPSFRDFDLTSAQHDSCAWLIPDLSIIAASADLFTEVALLELPPTGIDASPEAQRLLSHLKAQGSYVENPTDRFLLLYVAKDHDPILLRSYKTKPDLGAVFDNTFKAFVIVGEGAMMKVADGKILAQYGL